MVPTEIFMNEIFLEFIKNVRNVKSVKNCSRYKGSGEIEETRVSIF